MNIASSSTRAHIVADATERGQWQAALAEGSSPL
jgi:hypothetical protein